MQGSALAISCVPTFVVLFQNKNLLPHSVRLRDV